MYLSIIVIWVHSDCIVRNCQLRNGAPHKLTSSSWSHHHHLQRVTCDVPCSLGAWCGSPGMNQRRTQWRWCSCGVWDNAAKYSSLRAFCFLYVSWNASCRHSSSNNNQSLPSFIIYYIAYLGRAGCSSRIITSKWCNEVSNWSKCLSIICCPKLWVVLWDQRVMN